MITTLPGAQRMKPGSAGTPLPGVRATVVDNDGREVQRDVQGLLTLRHPWPGMLRTLYKEPDRYLSGLLGALRCAELLRRRRRAARTTTATSG